MSVGKMGLTIEEAAETTGIGRNTMRKLIDWGKKRPAEKPPEKQSVREQLRRLQEEGRKTPRNRNRDYER